MSKTIVEIPEWFHGCELNFAENLLKHPDDNKVALITYGEGQVPGYITFGQLKQRVGTIATALRASGVTRETGCVAIFRTLTWLWKPCWPRLALGRCGAQPHRILESRLEILMIESSMYICKKDIPLQVYYIIYTTM